MAAPRARAAALVFALDLDADPDDAMSQASGSDAGLTKLGAPITRAPLAPLPAGPRARVGVAAKPAESARGGCGPRTDAGSRARPRAPATRPPPPPPPPGAECCICLDEYAADRPPHSRMHWRW